MDKAKRAEYLDKIIPLEKSLDTGRVWLVSNSYSEAHNALSEAVSTVKAYLTFVENKENLNEKEQGELKGLINDVKEAAEAYISEKRNVDHYALNADKRQGIKAASGDKLTRLMAAEGLRKVSDDLINNNPMAGTNQDKIKKVRLEEVISAREADRKKAEGRERGMRAFSSLKSFENEKTKYLNGNYKTGGAWTADALKNHGSDVKKELREGLKLISSLHRDEILYFDSSQRSKIDEEFITKYKATRLDMEKAVHAYDMLKRFKESAVPEENQIAESVLLSVGVTDRLFEEMGIKRTELQYMGQYFDTRADMMKSPSHIGMSKEERKELEKMNVEGLLERSTNTADRERSDYIRNMAKIKQLSVFGIKPITPGSVRKEANTYEKVSEGKRSRGILKFLNVYVKGKKPGLGRLIPKDADYDMKDKEKAAEAGIDIEAGAVKGKLKVMKLSGRLKSKNGLFRGDAKLNVGRAAVGAAVGLSLSASDLLNSKIQLLGEAEVAAVHGTLKGRVGNTKYVAADIKADGNFLYAGAKGGISAGLTSYVDSNGDTHEVRGVSVGVEAMASLVKGKVSGGFTACGVRFGAGLEGVAVGFGGEAGAKILGDSVSISLGAALGLGFGLKFSIDWSGLKKRFWNWRKREKQRDKIRENEAAKLRMKLNKKKKNLRQTVII